MAVDTITDFTVLLAKGGLLQPAQLEEITAHLQAHFPEPRALAGELVRRNWLTPFQVNKIFTGHGHELVLGSYLLLERLGVGGMGEVYKARHARLDKIVAIKLIRPERLNNADMVRRFQREVRAAAQLNHPNVVHAYDCDEAEGKHFLVLEYVEGIDLARLVKKQGPLPVALACECIRQAALGLQHAFERGLVHRDIKPHNLLLTWPAGPPPSGAPVVKILDLGLARVSQAADSEATSTVTAVGTVMGTLDYLAPEQALDAHAADTRSDLYSLGCTFYFLLTGQVPFPGGSATEKLLKHQSQHPIPLQRVRPDTPPAVAALVSKLMAKQPLDRYQTPAEVAALLSNLDNLPVASLQPLPDSSREESMADTTPGWSSLVASREQAGIVSSSDLQGPGDHVRWKPMLFTVGICFVILGCLLAYLRRGGEPPAPSMHRVVEPEIRKEKPPRTSEQWRKQVELLPVEQQLKEVIARLKNRNFEFDGDVKSTIKDGVVIGLEFNSENVSDLRPLQALPRLQTLVCSGNRDRHCKLSDLSPLQGMKLSHLNCNFTQVADLSPLRGMPLRVFLCAFASVTDLSPLQGMDLLTLNVNGNRGLTVLSPLRGMSLNVLFCMGTGVTDLSSLRGMPLRTLLCPVPATKDHATLRSLKHLRQLNRRPIAEFWKEAGENANGPGAAQGQ